MMEEALDDSGKCSNERRVRRRQPWLEQPTLLVNITALRTGHQSSNAEFVSMLPHYLYWSDEGRVEDPIASLTKTRRFDFSDLLRPSNMSYTVWTWQQDRFSILPTIQVQESINVERTEQQIFHVNSPNPFLFRCGLSFLQINQVVE